MGYSCNKAAGLTLDSILEQVAPFPSPTNTWEYKGNKYFFERGREQDDGAITGQVWRMDPEDAQGRCFCHRSGSARIEPGGRVTRFPHISKQVKKVAEKYSKDTMELDKFMPSMI
jgi:hypothetical protein